ncbi:MAG: GH3 auxin-responsive promoter family protein [Verrucomicrobiota bacterium]
MLSRYIQSNVGSAFGREYGFADITSYEDFANKVPLQSYMDIEPWVERAINGEVAVLTKEEPVGFELTSGTSSAVKVIPVTPKFRGELACALSIWMKGWQQRYPEVFEGAAYWSLSPRLGKGEKTSSGLPLGFTNDGAYFPDEVSYGLAKWLVAPEFGESDFFEQTAKVLLTTSNLRSISVWSPVFFLKLDEALDTRATWREIWPELRVLSCWADAQAAMWKAQVLERLGEGVVFEPKGLLATEGVTSIPDGSAARIARGVHFHEFIDCETGDVSLEVKQGRRYEVVLTTGAGLYRYRTGDIIEAGDGGRVGFVGRRGDCSDLVGEKLDGEHVVEAFRKAGVSGFIRVREDQRAYEIWVTDRGADVLAELRRNLHFSKALDTAQLDRCLLRSLPRGWASEAARYLANKRFSREGDVKLPVIERGELSALWES